MKLRYVGPHDGVFIPLPSGREITVAHGDEFEVDDDEFARSLLDQPANFEAAVKAAKSEPAGEKPSAEKSATAGGKG